MDIRSLLVGAVVGAVPTFLITRWQTRQASKAQTHTTRWHTGIAAARQMLADLEDMRGRLDHLDPRSNPGGPSRVSGGTTRQQRFEAQAAHDRLRQLNSTHAVQLPEELGSRWYSMTQLVDDYLEAQRQRGEWWDGPRLNRAQSDVLNYMDYVRQSLATYVKTGDETKRFEPPLLSRDDLESWMPR